MTISPEQLAAYVDGECDPAEAQRIAGAAEADPALAERIARERALRERLRGHFAPVAEEPLPAAWEALIREATGAQPQGSAAVIDLAEARARRGGADQSSRWNRNRLPWIGGAIAASLVLGLMLGLNLRPGAPFAARDGALVAQGRLAAALDTQLASAQDNAPVRMLVTFRATDGAICRAFTGRQASGIACRSGDAWQLRHVLPGLSAGTTEYRQAGSSAAELTELAQGMAAGDAFDARQEQAAKERGWR